ncbi:MAG: DUF6851 domain-containing protein [Crocinitomicaceae bacterium]
MMTKSLYGTPFFHRRGLKTVFFLLFFLLSNSFVIAQHSVARQWKDAMLESIRNDFARPTVHARNLFHVSVGMYDAWAAYDSIAKPYMLGDSVGGFLIPFTGVPEPSNIDSARSEAISFAAYRMLSHRFQNSPGAATVLPLLDALMISLGYDNTNTSVNYPAGDPAALGNYIAQEIIAFGLQDGSNEQNDYVNIYYNPVNPSLAPTISGNSSLVDPDRWQPLSFDVFIDQSGNQIPFNTPEFLSPEWGAVIPFSLNDSVKNVYTRDGDDYVVYHDPSAPPYLDTVNASALIEEYQWGFSLVSVWSSHLDSTSNVLWDISPASIGNVQSYPTNVPDLQNFYDLTEGGDPGIGHPLNPATGLPYSPQIVPRADYARVLAEFWADGPDSETPPGHWFELLNYVSDHPDFEKKWKGKGVELDALEWDVKAYFTMGGAVHDAAIAAWGIKGWYDYIRPISAIRYMADRGQSTDNTLPNYSPDGIPLLAGYIELVTPIDIGQGFNASDTGKIKVLAWRGPDYISDPENDVAGVGWILAENWWPYQRPTFITPPFAGYISGHSTFSRAAAEVMTAMTGDEFFPGGMGEFVAVKDSFLVFEDGPSVDITLQWATYRDASDQCSLSRIWGGIHPPVDDIPGRLIGEKIGVRAFDYADKYMDVKQPSVSSISVNLDTISLIDVGVSTFVLTTVFDEIMDTTQSPVYIFPNQNPFNTITPNSLASSWLNDSTYIAAYNVNSSSEVVININVDIDSAFDCVGNIQVMHQAQSVFNIDTEIPSQLQLTANLDTINLSNVGLSTFSLTSVFDEVMDTLVDPTISFPVENPSGSISFNTLSSHWLNDSTFLGFYNVNSLSLILPNIDVEVTGATDKIGNIQNGFQEIDLFNIYKKYPKLLTVIPSVDTITYADTGVSNFSLDLFFDELMDTLNSPLISFPSDNPLVKTLVLNNSTSYWANQSKFIAFYDVLPAVDTLYSISVSVSSVENLVGVDVLGNIHINLFHIDKKLKVLEIDNFQNFGTMVYPNPIGEDGDFTVSFDETINSLKATITDITGRVILSETFNDTQSLDLKLQESSGVYILIIESIDHKSIIRLVKR